MAEQPLSITRRGAVAVVVEHGRFLVIRRSQSVVAPGKYCFPGGGIEDEETEEQALVREIREELGATVVPVRRLWESITPWGVHLAWWLSRLEPGNHLLPNPAEVESIAWLTAREMAELPEILESNLLFLEEIQAGRIELPHLGIGD
jgi:8-oxo-dGTP pyrophosphatase MutT (NUDIX family)